MSTILEATKIAYRLNAKQVESASSLLLTHFHINNFYYYKIYDSGRYFLFNDNLDVVDILESQQFVHKYQHYCHPRHHRNSFQLEKTIEDPLLVGLETTQSYFLKCEFHLGLSIMRKTEGTVEEFGFHSSKANRAQYGFLFNRLNDLRFFGKWFLEKNARLISFLEESALHLPNLIGSDFYKNRIQEADPSFQARQKFLRDLGIQENYNLSSSELDTLKLLAQGYTAREIGKRLYRSNRTIEHRIDRIKERLTCYSRVELIQKAKELEHAGYHLG